MQTIAKDNDSRLIKYLKMDEDRTNEAVESAINYLKLKESGGCCWKISRTWKRNILLRNTMYSVKPMSI